ncbi:MAG: Mu transposase C-terminal domain-containing protein [Phycisphaerae bacterium]|nr:DDE-type integrase/transposase/recombinase [Phycisphaerae bacterium]MCZ2398614.1 Mu transposase C-terminal domain-containing protein [Phycisphaerae bacterium]
MALLAASTPLLAADRLIALAGLRDALSERGGAAARVAALRWWHGLPPDLRVRRGRELLVRSAARLPDGRTAGEHLAARRRDPAPELAAEALPAALRDAGLRDQARAIATLHARRAFSRWAASRRGSLADWCRERRADLASWPVQLAGRDWRVRLPRAAKRLRAAFDRLSKDGCIDGRRRNGRAPSEPLPDDLRGVLLGLLHAGTSITLASAWRYVAGEARRSGRRAPSYHAVRRWYRAHVPRAVQEAARLADHEIEARLVPKIRRDYTGMAPLDLVSLDGHELNLMLRWPHPTRGQVRGRAVLTGVLDVATRYLVGWDMRRTEHADGILAGVKQCCRETGVPREFYLDNGSAYAAALGSNFARLSARVETLVSGVGAALTSARPRSAWVKVVESFWRRVIDDFERYWWSFWGSAGRDRPHDAEAVTSARLADLPTLEDVRSCFRGWLAEYHAQAHSGAGMEGLSPAAKLARDLAAPRRVSDDVLSVLASRLAGGERGLVVRRDGVRFDNCVYGNAQPERLLPLLDRRVWLRLDPERLDSVLVCDRRGEPLRDAAGEAIVLVDRVLSGATRDDLREATRIQRAARRTVKEQLGARDWLRRTPPQRIFAAKALHARQALADQGLDDAPPRVEAGVLIRPDLAAVAASAARQRRLRDSAAVPARVAPVQERLAAIGATGGSPPPPAPRAPSFAALAELADAVDEPPAPDYRRALALEAG